MLLHCCSIVVSLGLLGVEEMPFTQPINLELGLGGDADDNGRQQGGQRNRQQQSRRQPSPAAAPQPLNLTGGSQYVATPQADGAIFSWEKPVTLPIPRHLTVL